MITEWKSLNNYTSMFLLYLQVIIQFFFFYRFIFLFIFSWVGSSFLCKGFPQLLRAGATLHRGVWAFHRRGLSRCGAQAPDAQAQ